VPLRPTILSAAVLGAALLLPATASAIDYPAPQAPGKVVAKPKGPHKTRTVCKKRSCRFHTIQKAVKASRAGDTIRVKPGTYREGVIVRGAKKSWLRIIGDVKHPERVRLEGKGLKGARAQNAIKVDGANEVTLRGMKARHYKSNGFFVVNAVGYTLRNLIAERTGVYGIYAFNTKGGLMADSEAYYVNDAPFYIGQTPPQAKPIRSLVRNVSGWGSPIGFSGTNMRYVTITKSRFFNNALGIAPNALDSEAFPPAEDNVIVDNDIFWNNFNFHRGAPFPLPKAGSTGDLVPVGTGIILLGGRGNVVQNNRIFGNFLAGVVLIDGILLAEPENQDAVSLDDNRVTGNAFGAGGADTNGRDLVYDGSGNRNCFSGNQGVQNTFPADPARFPACDFGGSNGLSMADRGTMLGWSGEGALKGWAAHGHPALDGVTPLEQYKPAGAARAIASTTPRKRTVRIGDNYFSPSKLTVTKGTRITWRWPSYEESGSVHDVELVKRPAGVKRFHSESAASDYSYRRTLKVPGRYRLVCSYHVDMSQTIRVKR
jgi:plastocyanin